MRYIRVISGVVAALAFAATASAGSIEDKAQGTGGEVDVAIDISEKAFHVTKGSLKGVLAHDDSVCSGWPSCLC